MLRNMCDIVVVLWTTISMVLLYAELLAHNLATRFAREKQEIVALKECLYFKSNDIRTKYISNYKRVHIKAVTQ